MNNLVIQFDVTKIICKYFSIKEVIAMFDGKCNHGNRYGCDLCDSFVVMFNKVIMATEKATKKGFLKKIFAKKTFDETPKKPFIPDGWETGIY